MRLKLGPWTFVTKAQKKAPLVKILGSLQEH